MKKIFFLFISSILIISCSSSRLPKQRLTLNTSKKIAVHLDAEIASNEKDRDHGFMERRHIPDGTGMLFIFDHDQQLRFWMKNTPTPLSIAYIDHAGIIRDIFDMTPYSLADITSTVSVRYALEVPKGWFSREGIAVGDTLSLDFKSE